MFAGHPHVLSQQDLPFRLLSFFYPLEGGGGPKSQGAPT